MTNDEHRFRPCEIEEIEAPVSLLNEPPPPDNVAVLISRTRRPLCAVLIEALNNTQALLRRLEAGVQAPARGREPIRQLYVAARAHRDALMAALQIDDLE